MKAHTRLHELDAQLQSYLQAWLRRPAVRFEGGGYQPEGWPWCWMRHQVEGNSRSLEMHRTGRKGVAAVVNPCWKEEEESKLGAIALEVDWTDRPCGDVKNQWACE